MNMATKAKKSSKKPSRIKKAKALKAVKPLDAPSLNYSSLEWKYTQQN
jgi:hypothetical protein